MSERPSLPGLAAGAAATVFSIGHSTRAASELVDILRANGVARLVDIRTIPRSRKNPQFNLDALPATLQRAGLAYVHLAALGGLRGRTTSVEDKVNAGWTQRAFHDYADYAQSSHFRAGLRRLLAMASREVCAIMCAEAVWWRCHRRIVTDYLLALGVPVVNLFTLKKGEPASLTPFALVGNRGRVTYPAPSPATTTAEPRRRRAKAMPIPSKPGFHVGDHVSWSSEAGRVRGVIKKKLTAATKLKGYTARASKDEPQYLIESDKTDHIAVHKGSALRKLRRTR